MTTNFTGLAEYVGRQVYFAFVKPNILAKLGWNLDDDTLFTIQNYIKEDEVYIATYEAEGKTEEIVIPKNEVILRLAHETTGVKGTKVA